MKTCRAVICVLVVTLSCWGNPQTASSQFGTNAPAPHVVLRTLSSPVYPASAAVTAIAGDVQLKIFVQPDGKVESITTISGHPILVQAALESAQKSKFECIDCGDSTQSITLTYSFELAREGSAPCCSSGNSNSANTPRVEQQGEHITIATAPLCLCPAFFSTPDPYSRYRSPKCLYLWKCGKRLNVFM